ncbi:MAG: hypothetical protein Q9202_005699 [Teloschistes flavicans]
MEGTMDLPASEVPQAPATNPADAPLAADPIPNPPLNPSSQPSNAVQTYLSTTNNHIHHLSRYSLYPTQVSGKQRSEANGSRLLASTPSLDLTLATTSYTLSFIAAVLPRLGTLSPKTISTSKQPVDDLKPFLAKVPLSLKRLSSVLSEARTTLRLLGLVGVYTSLHSTFTSPPKDGVLKTIQWGQVIAGAVFQVCENIAFLGDKDILHSKRLGAQQRGKLWKLCCQAWLAATFLELARLARDFSLRQHPAPEPAWPNRFGPEGSEVSKAWARIHERNPNQKALDLTDEEMAEMDAAEEKILGSSLKILERIRETRPGPMANPLTEEELDELAAAGELDDAAAQARLESEEAERDAWPTKVMINAAYAPMTVHYSLDGGFMRDYELSLCGLVASGLGLAEAWKRTM